MAHFLWHSLPDLGDLDNGVFTQPQAGTNGDRQPINAGSRYIFSEITISYIQTTLFGRIDAFRRQKAHLAVPWSCMAIIFNAMIGYKGHIVDRLTVFRVPFFRLIAMDSIFMILKPPYVCFNFPVNMPTLLLRGTFDNNRFF